MSKHNSDLLRAAAEHVFQLFRNAKQDNPLVYHGFRRAREMVDACKEVAKGAKLDEDEFEPVVLAAWFHDSGYATGLDGNPEKSIELLRGFLAAQDQPQSLREAAVACLSRVGNGVPDRSGTLREDVLHDAMLVPLASKSYVEDSELLRLELERRKGKLYSDVEWTQKCIAFFESHPFRTRYAQLEYNARRAANLVRLHKLLRRQAEETAEDQAEQVKASRTIGKTVESIFYYLTKMQVDLVNLADRRTSTMIHVNAIMISIVVGLLLRRLDSERYLLVPTLFLLTVNLVVIFVSIYSMRAARSTLTAEEEHTHASNLLAFTNEAPMSLQEYSTRINHLAVDVPALQRTMIDQMYFVRKMLLARQRAMRATYAIFIYGLAASIVVFAVALVQGRGT